MTPAARPPERQLQPQLPDGHDGRRGQAVDVALDTPLDHLRTACSQTRVDNTNNIVSTDRSSCGCAR
jgi:hypothetical protein